MKKSLFIFLIILVAVGFFVLRHPKKIQQVAEQVRTAQQIGGLIPREEQGEGFGYELAKQALTLTKDSVTYDPSYFSIPYPNGDVPSDKGVCTDVIIRAYRKMNIDLQEKVHEDMKANFSLYPKSWGLTKTNTNIDHRRVPNLETFFARKGVEKEVTDNGADYLPGDIVTWNLGNLTHIGIVSNVKSRDKTRYLIIHNVGGGQELSDFLFSYPIRRHFSYEGN